MCNKPKSNAITYFCESNSEQGRNALSYLVSGPAWGQHGERGLCIVLIFLFISYPAFQHLTQSAMFSILNSYPAWTSIKMKCSVFPSINILLFSFLFFYFLFFSFFYPPCLYSFFIFKMVQHLLPGSFILSICLLSLLSQLFPGLK